MTSQRHTQKAEDVPPASTGTPIVHGVTLNQDGDEVIVKCTGFVRTER